MNNENTVQKELSGQATPEQIAAWKVKYGGVSAIIIEDKICYLRKLDRQILSFASLASKTDSLAFNDAILKNCWLGGDEDLRTDFDYYLTMTHQITALVVVKDAQLVKL
jgi:hypothetical protein